MQIADLHIHSKYSRATSSKMNLEELSKGAKTKGIDILGTGDFLHPLWVRELKEKLNDANGLYEYNGIKFVLSGEVSLIYTDSGKSRRVHHLLLAPDFEVLSQIIDFFESKGRTDYDGRPIFGISSVEMAEELMNISKDIEIIPAHVWTPWFAIFGSMSGFDSVEECFQDKAKYIHALETGLSSDPPMNWRLSSLDKYTLVSNSDSHSPYPHRLGREANAFDLKEITYHALINAIRTRKDFLFTIEVDPAYGKYHFDGHRNCNFSCHPKESIKLNNICPKCKSKLTIGVLHRIEELADRPEGFRPANSIDYKSLLPLLEIISNVLNVGMFTKKTYNVFNKLISAFGNEFNILLNVKKEELEKVVDKKIADAIILNRTGKIKITPGYDGVYGVPHFLKDQRNIEDFVKK